MTDSEPSIPQEVDSLEGWELSKKHGYACHSGQNCFIKKTSHELGTGIPATFVWFVFTHVKAPAWLFGANAGEYKLECILIKSLCLQSKLAGLFILYLNTLLKLQDTNLKDKQFKTSLVDTAGNEIFFPWRFVFHLTSWLNNLVHFLKIYIRILNSKLCTSYLFWVFY